MNQSQHFNNVIKRRTKISSPPEVKLLCHFDQSLADSSVYNRTATILGTIAYINSAGYYKFGYSVRALGPTSGTRTDGYVSYDISDVDLSKQFCIDFWFRNYGSYGSHYPLILVPSDVEIGGNNVSNASFLYYIDSSDSSSTGIMSYNPATSTRRLCNLPRSAAIHHIAITRDATDTLRIFQDGILKDSYTNTFDFTSREIHFVQTYSNGTGNYLCVDEARIVSGAPCYTETFTPRSEPYTLLDI